MRDTVDKFMDMFKNKDKKLLGNLAVAFVAGVLLIIASGIFSKNNNTDITVDNPVLQGMAQAAAGDGRNDYERGLEQRLEETLSLVQGAGKVKVMLTLSNTGEIVIAENTEYNKKSTVETDNAGGTRAIEELKTRNDVITTVRGSSGEPLVLKEIQPKVEGVIIIAQGGDEVMVRDALTRAAQAALGVEIHKIQVLKMKSDIKEEQ